MTFQTITRGAARRIIGSHLGICIDGTATSTVDTSSLIDTKYLLGGDDQHNGKEVLIHTPTGSIVAGESSIVSDFAGSTNDATCAPVFSAAITTGDQYEIWATPWRIIDINKAINQTIDEVSGLALAVKETHTAFTEDSKYLYNVLSGYSHLEQVEYAYSVGTEKTIHKCDAVWNESVDADVTASLDTTFKKEGGGSLKLVVAATASAADILATEDITSLDLSGCTEVQIWIYSTVALSAGDLQLLLDNTASCASPVESLNIPATTANTWTRHIISLANPQSDAAIISVGLKMVVDKGAFTLWSDDIKAIDALTNQYRVLAREYWDVSQGSTPYLKLTYNGLSAVGTNKQLRLTGWAMPARLSADATNCTVDPAYVIAKTTARLLVGHANSSSLKIPERFALAQYWEGIATRMLPGLSPNLGGDVIAIKQ